MKKVSNFFGCYCRYSIIIPKSLFSNTCCGVAYLVFEEIGE